MACFEQTFIEKNGKGTYQSTAWAAGTSLADRAAGAAAGHSVVGERAICLSALREVDDGVGEADPVQRRSP